MGDQPHDVLGVQDQIRKLKLRRSVLLLERVDIKAEIDKYEVNKRALKSELNVLLPLEELRFVKAVDENNNTADEYGGSFNPIDEKIFLEMNRKLELQILNSEIRLALPQLERIAVQREMNVHHVEKQATSQVNKMEVSSIFSKGVLELQGDIDSAIEGKMRMRGNLGKEVDEMRKEKRFLTNEIGRLRELIGDGREMNEILKMDKNRTALNLKRELARIKVLRAEEEKVTEMIRSCKEQK